MAQKLILPINDCRITAGYKNANYKKQFGYTHYGVDMTDRQKKNTKVYASGDGVVADCGWSNSGGNVIAICYPNCEGKNGKWYDITIRYYHLDSIKIKKGQPVNKDTVIAYYGNTGASSGAHLHIEVDYDGREQYAMYTPQISKNSGVLKKGTDTTLNPCDILFVKTSSPDNQRVVDSGYDTVSSTDLTYQKL